MQRRVQTRKYLAIKKTRLKFWTAHFGTVAEVRYVILSTPTYF